jgi:ABC-type polysaccharide/polyol phosphate transport system ATPase subunit
MSLEERAPSEPSLAIRACETSVSATRSIGGRKSDCCSCCFARSKRFYREFWALRGVDLDLRRGETVGIVGRNGAGKTTLLQLLAGTLQATEGELEVQGRVTSLLELGSGFNGEFTGRENVFLNGAVLGVSRAEMDARFDQDRSVRRHR